MQSIQRRALARRLLAGFLTKEVTSERLWELVSTPPIFNDITVYGPLDRALAPFLILDAGTIMCPLLGILQTRLPRDSIGFVSMLNDGRPISTPKDLPDAEPGFVRTRC